MSLEEQSSDLTTNAGINNESVGFKSQRTRFNNQSSRFNNQYFATLKNGFDNYFE